MPIEEPNGLLIELGIELNGLFIKFYMDPYTELGCCHEEGMPDIDE
jgi:hypothetical protein